MRSLNKKANMFNNTVIVIVGLLAICFAAILTRIIYEEIMAVYRVQPEFSGANFQSVISGMDFAVGIFDGLILLLTLGLVIGVIWFSYIAEESAWFWVIVFLGVPFLGIFAYFCSYLFIQLVGDTAFTTVLQYFPITTTIATNFHWLCLMIIVLSSLARYIKRKREDSAGEVLI
jgi:hypothetical protein